MNVQNEWAEISLRAQRVWGQKLDETELNKGRPSKKGLHDVTLLPTLSDLDTTKQESHRVGLIAFLPDDIFESYIIETMAPTELTTAGALRLARKLQPKSETPLLPEGKYRVILADPPWEYSNAGLGGSAEKHYATMPLEARIWDTLILCRGFKSTLACKKAGGGSEIRLHNAPEATSTTFGYC